jgi:hypothetical protein
LKARATLEKQGFLVGTDHLDIEADFLFRPAAEFLSVGRFAQGASTDYA